MLTKKQLDLLELIHKRMQKDGVPPSFDEMKEALDLRSKSGIHRLITALEERGFIRRLAHRARAIEIIKLPDSIANKSAGTAQSGFTPRVIEGDRPKARPKGASDVSSIDAQDIPLVGRIAAGEPIEAITDAGTNVPVPGGMLLGGGNHYALEVKGDSMIDAGINHGDIVVIRETSAVDDGDIVVAQVDGYEATLKTIRRKGRTIALEPANASYETRLFNEDQVEVQGKLVGLIRTY